MVTLGSYPLEGIITAVIPDFFGRYVNGDFWVSNVPWSIPLYNLYVGILPLILIFFISDSNGTDRKVVYFAGALAIGAFFLSLGANTPLYKLIYLLPGFDRIRAPAKIIYLYVFALSLLAGKGMDGFMKLSGRTFLRRAGIVLAATLVLILLDGIFHWNKSFIFSFFSPFILDEMIIGKTAHATGIIGDEFHIMTLLCIAISLVIFLGAKGFTNKKLAAALLCMLILFDLAYMNRGAIRYGDNGYEWTRKTRDNLSQSLGQDKSISRVGSYPNPMGPNFEMLLGYQTVSGYNPLYLHRYYEYIRKYNPSLLRPGNVSFFYHPKGETVLMDLLNVKYEISHTDGTYSIRNSNFPRVFFVPDHEVLEQSQILDRLVQPDFDVKQKVLFETEDFPALIKNQKPAPDILSAKSKAEILSWAPDEILASVNAPVPGYLFFSEIYYPGWTAFVDDLPAPIMRGDYLFRVIPVPKGYHRVKMAFNPPTIKWGIGITSLTLFLIAILSVLHCFGRSRLSRRRPEQRVL